MKLPKRVANRELDPSKLQPESQAILAKYLEKPKPFMLILGPHGAGKTTLCACISNYFKAAPTVRYWKEASMLSELKQEALNAYRTIDYWAQADLFLLDDWLSVTSSEFDTRVVNYLLDARRDNCRPTILTSSMPAEELQAEIEENYRILRPSSELVLIDLER